MLKADRFVGRGRLLAGAALLQLVVAVAVRITPVSNLWRTAGRLRGLRRMIPGEAGGAERSEPRLTRGGSPAQTRGDEDQVIRAIDATGRWLPLVSTCLVRAIVAEILLASPDRPLTVTIGIRRTRASGDRDAWGGLEAHAWVERDGRALVGGPGEHLFAPLLGWESRRACEGRPA
jgi:hypothetical protein